VCFAPLIFSSFFHVTCPPARIYIYVHHIYISKYLISQIKKCVPIFYIESSVCAGQRYRHDHLSRVPESVLFPSAVFCSWEGIRQGPPAHLKKRPKSFGEGAAEGLLGRGEKGEGAAVCFCVCECSAALSLAGSAQPGSQLCQRFQCEQECCFSPPAVYAPQSVEFRVALCWRRAAASRPDYFASWEAKCSDILTAEFPTREKVNRSRLTFAVLFYFLFGF
jgi:hypothetical protein